MNKYLQFMHDAKQAATTMLEKDIANLLGEISTPSDKYSFRFHAGAWDWMLNGEILVFSTSGYEVKGSQRNANPHSEKFQEIDKAIISLIKEYHFASQFKTINAPEKVMDVHKGVSVAEEKANFLKQMETVAEALRSGHFDAKANP